MSNFIECAKYFKHHQPIPMEAMARMAIGGTDGAFRQMIINHSKDPDTPTVGVGILVNTSGDIMGSQMLKLGKIKMKPQH